MTRLACVCALAACSTGDVVVIGDLQEVATLKAIPNRDLDVLFVVDNSPSMTEKQASLAASFPRMLDPLATLDSGVPNLHIGVVTSDMGTTGSADPSHPAPSISMGPGACAGFGDDGALHTAAAVTGSFIVDVAQPDGSRMVNYTGTLGDAFAQLASVGDVGCGFEQHLRSMQRGLTNPANAGFVRDGANLAVVILADEDDCSVLSPAFFGDAPELGPLQSYRCFTQGVRCDPDDPNTIGARANCVPRADSAYVEDIAPLADALVALKKDPRRVMVAGIVGDPSPVAVDLEPPPGGGTPVPTLGPSCVFATMQHADPAVRLAAFMDRFPGRSQLTSICDPDLSGALSQIGDTAKKLVGDPCLAPAQLVDRSPDPGLQPACEVTDVRDAAPDRPQTLPECVVDGQLDCFQFVADAHACPDTADHLRVDIARSHEATDDTWTHVRCQLQ
jgi:hypothetical protein